MYMLISGYTHQKIANKLGVTKQTIKNYLYEGEYSIFAKLDAASIAQAVAKWMRRDGNTTT